MQPVLLRGSTQKQNALARTAHDDRFASQTVRLVLVEGIQQEVLDMVPLGMGQSCGHDVVVSAVTCDALAKEDTRVMSRR